MFVTDLLLKAKLSRLCQHASVNLQSNSIDPDD